jgi:alpha-1,3-mannosyltransferase
MRVLHVTRQYYPSVGGIESSIRNLSRQIQLAGHEVHIITLNRLFSKNQSYLPSEETLDGVPTKRIPYLGPSQYAVAPAVLAEIRNYDLIHLHSCDFFLDYLALAKPIHRKPMVLTSHGIYFHTPFASRIKRIYFRTITRLNLRQISEIICVSQHDYELLSRIAPTEKLHMIPNGIDYDNFVKLNPFDCDPNLLLSVGRLASNKRYDRLLKTFARVVVHNPAARLRIIGPDLGFLDSLKGLTHELNLSDKVDFLGKASEDELLKNLDQANIWLSSTSYEAFGIALLEAMAAGCVPVIQPLSVFKQFLTDKSEGFYADFDQPENASKVILNTLNLSQEERGMIISRARAKAANYSWNTISRQILKIYLRQSIRADSTYSL